MRHAVGRDEQHPGGQRVGDPGDHPAQPGHPGRGVAGPRPGHPDRGREGPTPGAVANGTASAAVTPPSAIRRSRSAATLAAVNGVPVDPTLRPPEAAPDGAPEAILSRAAVATTALPRNGTGATKLPSTSAAAAASR